MPHLDCSLESGDDDDVAKGIVDKILALSTRYRLWPNCLDRPVHNASHVNVGECYDKLNNAVVKYDGSDSEMPVAKSVPTRTRRKLPTHAPKRSRSVLSASFDSEDSPEAEKGVELSSGR